MDRLVASGSLITRRIGTRKRRATATRISRLLLLTLRRNEALAVLIDTHRSRHTDTVATTAVCVQTSIAALAVSVLAATRCVATGDTRGRPTEIGSGRIRPAETIVVWVVGTVLVIVTEARVAAAEGIPRAGVTVVCNTVTIAVGCLVCSTVVSYLACRGV